jgi:hypothetical protein
MPFTFDFTDVKPGPDGEEVYTDPSDPKKWSLLAQWINSQAMSCGINTITEANLQEVTRRVMIAQYLDGPAFRYDTGKVYVKPEDVKLLVGYRCNASSYTTKEFDKQVMEAVKMKAFEIEQKDNAWEIIKKRARDAAKKQK